MNTLPEEPDERSEPGEPGEPGKPGELDMAVLFRNVERGWAKEGLFQILHLLAHLIDE
jgi:hypothetical protein